KIRVGISGWRYKGWRGKFYPAKLCQKDELRYATEKFSTIEINGTFYSLQTVESFTRWAAETPKDFVFAVKGSRFLTHILRLREVETPLATFFASGLLALGAKLGPFLWQFPPNFKFDPERLAAFFKLLPRDHESAATRARGGEPKDAERVIDKLAPKRAARDVYVYFDNDAKVRAPGDALSLVQRIRQLQSLENR